MLKNKKLSLNKSTLTGLLSNVKGGGQTCTDAGGPCCCPVSNGTDGGGKNCPIVCQ